VPARSRRAQTIEGCATSSPTPRRSSRLRQPTPTSSWSGRATSCRDLIVSKPEIVISAFHFRRAVAVRTDTSQKSHRSLWPATTCWPFRSVDAEGRLEGNVHRRRRPWTRSPPTSKRRLPPRPLTSTAGGFGEVNKPTFSIHSTSRRRAVRVRSDPGRPGSGLVSGFANDAWNHDLLRGGP